MHLFTRAARAPTGGFETALELACAEAGLAQLHSDGRVVTRELSGGTARDALRAFVGADGSGDSSGGGEGSGGGGEASLAVRLAELAVGAAGHTLGTSLGAAQDDLLGAWPA